MLGFNLIAIIVVVVLIGLVLLKGEIEGWYAAAWRGECQKA
jgi:preprotein translocase subunit SecG